MGIDLHTFRFVERLARQGPLGRVLTIGRQGVDFDPALVGTPPAADAEPGYCEWVFRALGASGVDSVDVSEYEHATYVADLGAPATLPRRYDTVIDAGSLEHIFDVAAAFRNVIGFAAPGGRIVHVLPVNNLSGHGFWQFSSDLIYALYSPVNGFADTRVYYASSINTGEWRLVPPPSPGTRTEMVSVEPVILLSTTTKRAEVSGLTVMQPFYATAWDQGAAEPAAAPARSGGLVPRLRRFGLFRLARNAYTVAGLLFGTSRYALRGRRFARHRADGGKAAP